MEESKVLSPAEVDALLKNTSSKNDITKLINNSDNSEEDLEKLNSKALSNIIELTWSECEKILTSFLRKKVSVRAKDSVFGSLQDVIENKREKHIYTIFHTTPESHFCLTILSMPLLHQMINVLCGGAANSQEPIMESPGKMGLLFSEKITSLLMEGFSAACKEYGTVTHTLVKVVTLPNLISKIGMETEVALLNYSLFFGEIETDFSLVIPVEFLQQLIPVDIDDKEGSHARVNQLWRKAIENQVIDSTVTLVVSLPSVKLNATELISLKEGDLIPIGDPTAVEVYLNHIKLFDAMAAQSNSNLIVKILQEI